jgi:hypothetical protein
MAQTAYEEAGMWAVKATTEVYSYGAHRQNINPLYQNKPQRARLYKDKTEMYVVFGNYRSHTLRHNFSNGFGFINITPQVCKGELMVLKRRHISSTQLNNGIPIWNKTYNLYVKVTQQILTDSDAYVQKNDGNFSVFSMEEFIHINTA